MEIDGKRFDLWSTHFIEIFNNPAYEPTRPNGCDGVPEGLLQECDPRIANENLTGSFIKDKLSYLRFDYTKAYTSFMRSCQSGSE